MDVQIYKELRSFGKLRANVALSKMSTFRIGGNANLFLEITDTNNFVSALNFISKEGLNFFILGGGSNVLFPDNEFEKIVIKVKNEKIKIDDGCITADAGVSFGMLLNKSLQSSLSGLEWSAGLPGTIGGAVRGNAGAAGGSVSESLKSVKVWLDGEVVEMKNSDCDFGYRESCFKENGGVILESSFNLVNGDKSKSLSLIQGILKKRNGYYPPFPSAGCFFKNVKSDEVKGTIPKEFLEKGFVPAGWLIDKSGLKGRTVGGAMVSKEHGNFIINFDNASQGDVVTLVDEVKAKVYNNFNVQLTEEVQIVN